jgi:hypothetical protein
MATKETLSTHVKQKLGTLPEIDPFESVDTSLEEVKRLIDWLGYVSESEYTELERERLISVARRFTRVAQPIASKYLD